MEYRGYSQRAYEGRHAGRGWRTRQVVQNGVTYRAVGMGAWIDITR
jgi:hypothetical protein